MRPVHGGERGGERELGGGRVFVGTRDGERADDGGVLLCYAPHLLEVHGVRVGLPRVEVVRHAQQVGDAVRVEVLSRVAHAVDAAVAGKREEERGAG